MTLCKNLLSLCFFSPKIPLVKNHKNVFLSNAVSNFLLNYSYILYKNLWFPETLQTPRIPSPVLACNIFKNTAPTPASDAHSWIHGARVRQVCIFSLYYYLYFWTDTSGVQWCSKITIYNINLIFWMVKRIRWSAFFSDSGLPATSFFAFSFFLLILFFLGSYGFKVPCSFKEIISRLY